MILYSIFKIHDLKNRNQEQAQFICPLNDVVQNAKLDDNWPQQHRHSIQ